MKTSFILVCFWCSLVYMIHPDLLHWADIAPPVRTFTRLIFRCRWRQHMCTLRLAPGVVVVVNHISVWTKEHQNHTRMKCSNRFMSTAYRLWWWKQDNCDKIPKRKKLKASTTGKYKCIKASTHESSISSILSPFEKDVSDSVLAW